MITYPHIIQGILFNCLYLHPQGGKYIEGQMKYTALWPSTCSKRPQRVIAEVEWGSSKICSTRSGMVSVRVLEKVPDRRNLIENNQQEMPLKSQ